MRCWGTTEPAFDLLLCWKLPLHAKEQTVAPTVLGMWFVLGLCQRERNVVWVFSERKNEHSFFFLRFFKIYLLLERGEGREKEGERNIDQLSLAHPQLGTRPATQACALTGNQTGGLLVCKPVLNPLSPSSQGKMSILYLTVTCFTLEMEMRINGSLFVFVAKYHITNAL